MAGGLCLGTHTHHTAPAQLAACSSRARRRAALRTTSWQRPEGPPERSSSHSRTQRRSTRRLKLDADGQRGSHGETGKGDGPAPPPGASIAQPNPVPWPPSPAAPTTPGGRGRHLRVEPHAGNGDTPWDGLSVVELRALLRDYPIDRTSLPAPIENLRRAELIEALRQIGALGFGGEGA